MSEVVKTNLTAMLVVIGVAIFIAPIVYYNVADHDIVEKETIVLNSDIPYVVNDKSLIYNNTIHEFDNIDITTGADNNTFVLEHNYGDLVGAWVTLNSIVCLLDAVIIFKIWD